MFIIVYIVFAAKQDPMGLLFFFRTRTLAPLDRRGSQRISKALTWTYSAKDHLVFTDMSPQGKWTTMSFKKNIWENIDHPGVCVQLSRSLRSFGPLWCKWKRRFRPGLLIVKLQVGDFDQRLFSHLTKWLPLVASGRMAMTSRWVLGCTEYVITCFSSAVGHC